MNYSIIRSAACFIAALFCFIAPASAAAIWSPVTLQNVGWGDPYGQYGAGGFYYAGGIYSQIVANPGTISGSPFFGEPFTNAIPAPLTAAGDSIIFCDDLGHTIGGGTYSNFYESSDITGVNTFLMNGGLSLTDAQRMEGLVMYATDQVLEGSINSTEGAELQLAIWEIEDPSVNGGALQGAVDSYLANAWSDYVSYSATHDWTVLQLDAPCGNAAPDSISFINTGDCATQGQVIGIYNGNGVFNNPVPEPLTLSMFGVGLVGAAAMRRRRKADNASH